MDFILYPLVFLTGALAGWFLRGSKTVEVERVKTVAQHLGPDGVYVRFTYPDGRVEVRKFKPTDLDFEMEWRGRKFQAGEWTPDGHVYNEVVNG